MTISRPLEPDFHDHGVSESEKEERDLIDKYIRHDIQAMAFIFSQVDLDELDEEEDTDGLDDDDELEDGWPTLDDVIDEEENFPGDDEDPDWSEQGGAPFDPLASDWSGFSH